MKTHPTLIFEGKDSTAKMEVIGHLPPGSGKHMPIVIHAIRYVIIDLTDDELDNLIELSHSDRKEYKASLLELLDSHPCTFNPQ